VTKILVRWEQLLCASLDTYTLEENLINFYASHNDGGFVRGGLILQKTKILLDPDNTPFRYIISYFPEADLRYVEHMCRRVKIALSLVFLGR